MKLLILKPLYKKIIILLRPTQIFNSYKRFGKIGDGGYVIPDEVIQNLKDCDLLSFGINDDSSFESDFLKYNSKAKCFAFDPSIEDLPEGSNKKIEFRKLGIAKNNYGRYRNLNFFIQTHGNSKYILKFDIEGYEWEILDDITKFQKQFPLVICELHFKSISSINKILYPYYLWKRYNILKNFLGYYSITFLNTNNIYYSLFDNKAFPNLVELTLVSNEFLLKYYNKKTRSLCHLTDVNKKHYLYPFDSNSVDG